MAIWVPTDPSRSAEWIFKFTRLFDINFWSKSPNISECQFPLYFWAFLLVKLKRFAGDQNDWENKWKFVQDLRMAYITISHMCIILWQLLRKWDTQVHIENVNGKESRWRHLQTHQSLCAHRTWQTWRFKKPEQVKTDLFQSGTIGRINKLELSWAMHRQSWI